jgi:hypothetical protein
VTSNEAAIFKPTVKYNFAWDSIVILSIVDLEISGRDNNTSKVERKQMTEGNNSNI